MFAKFAGQSLSNKIRDGIIEITGLIVGILFSRLSRHNACLDGHALDVNVLVVKYLPIL